MQPLRILVTVAFRNASFVFAEAPCFVFLHGKLIGYPEIIQRSRAESGHFAVPFRGSTTSSIVDGKKAEAMSMILSEGEIGTFQECVRRDLLTYVSYPSFKGATRCFAYPPVFGR